jgi:hypothetical protein
MILIIVILYDLGLLHTYLYQFELEKGHRVTQKVQLC